MRKKNCIGQAVKSELSIFQIIRIAIFLLFTSITTTLFAQWNPDAGYIKPFTDEQGVSVTTSSNTTGNKIIDGDLESFWQSDAPLPTGYITRGELNFLLNHASSNNCTGSDIRNPQNATDGSTWTHLSVVEANGQAWLQMNLAELTDLRSLTLRCLNSDTVYVNVILSNNTEQNIGMFVPSLSNRYIRLSSNPDDQGNYTSYFSLNQQIKGIKLHSHLTFKVQEIAALNQQPFEEATVDLGAVQNIGWVNSYHMAGNFTDLTELFLSDDNSNWTKIADLAPNANGLIPVVLNETANARYIKIRHTLKEGDYNKCFIWELQAYGQGGPYGEKPAPEPQTQTMKDMLGINTIWGWGNNKCSKYLEPGEGPSMYNDFMSRARYYHNMVWDIPDPDETPDYSNMPYSLTGDGQNWLNWDEEYLAVNDWGMNVRASIQFLPQWEPVDMWDNAYQAAYNYGYAFANHFGPSTGTGTVKALEVGNEPWEYPAEFYSTVLEGMAKGAKDADPQIKVLPCALQAGNPNKENESLMNYMGARLTETAAGYIDGINSHYYSYFYNQQGERLATFPENPLSSFWGILNDIQFRDANMPDKDIYVTEWGWDSEGAGEDCPYDYCVTETEQAVYLARGAMILSRLGVKEMDIYYYANTTGWANVYSRSGLTASRNLDFAKKKSFYAMQSMIYHLGEYLFLDALQEDDDAWIYLFGDAEGSPTYIAAWKPVSPDETSSLVTIQCDTEPYDAVLIDGNSEVGTTTNLPLYENGMLSFEVSATPLLIRLTPEEPNTGNEDIAYWDMNQCEGNIVINKAGNQDGQIIGTPEWVEGYAQQGLQLNGTDNYVAISGFGTLQTPYAEMSMAAWFKSNEDFTDGVNPSTCILMAKNANYDIKLSSFGDQFKVDAEYFLNGTYTSMYGGTYANGKSVWDLVIDDNNWHHIASTYNGSEIKLFIDGELIISKTASGVVGNPGSQTVSTNPLYLGVGSSGSTIFLKGCIDEVSVYSTALSQDDLSGLAGLTYSPVACQLEKSMKKTQNKNQNAMSFECNLYPNPVTDALTVTTFHTDGEMQVEIYDSTGKCIFKKPTSENRLSIQLKGISNGLYSLVLSNGKQKTVRKFIVQNKN